MNQHDTREGWLKSAMILLDQKFFGGQGHELPAQVKCSCGFPKYGSGKAIGQCWDHVVSTNGTYEMFICPTQDNPLRVLDILLHEMIHACVGIKAGHKKPFKKLATAFGLEGKMTATYVTEGTPLWQQLKEIADQLGPYPHAALVPAKKPSRQPKRIVFYSPQEPKFMVTCKLPVIEEFGKPKDPWGNEMKRKDEPDDDETEPDGDDE